MLVTVLQTVREASVLRGGCVVTVWLVEVTHVLVVVFSGGVKRSCGVGCGGVWVMWSHLW
jgi:hypothetical protein